MNGKANMAKRSNSAGAGHAAHNRATARNRNAAVGGGPYANTLWLERYAKPGEVMPSAEELGKRQDGYKRELKKLWARYDKASEAERADLRLLIQSQTLKVYLGG